jgi:hypothetical protein
MESVNYKCSCHSQYVTQRDQTSSQIASLVYPASQELQLARARIPLLCATRALVFVLRFTDRCRIPGIRPGNPSSVSHLPAQSKTAERDETVHRRKPLG